MSICLHAPGRPPPSQRSVRREALAHVTSRAEVWVTTGGRHPTGTRTTTRRRSYAWNPSASSCAGLSRASTSFCRWPRRGWPGTCQDKPGHDTPLGRSKSHRSPGLGLKFSSGHRVGLAAGEGEDTSSGRTVRPIAMPATIWRICSGVRSPRVISGLDQARRHGIDRDAERRELARPGAGDGGERALGHGVVAHGGRTGHGEGRAGIDDAAELRAFIPGTTACAAKNAPLTWVSNMLSKNASSIPGGGHASR